MREKGGERNPAADCTLVSEVGDEGVRGEG